MKKILSVLILLLPLTLSAALDTSFYRSVPGNPFINGTAVEGYELLASRSCMDLSCVQQMIRVIDSQIGDLLARRLAFVKRGAQLKSSAVMSNNDQVDPNVIGQMTRQAAAQGVPSEIAQAVFTEIDKQSQAFESKFKGLPPNAPPGALATPTHNVSDPVITPTITHGWGATQTIVPGADVQH